MIRLFFLGLALGVLGHFVEHAGKWAGLWKGFIGSLLQ